MTLHAQRPQTTRVSDDGHGLAKRVYFGVTVFTVSLLVLRYMYNDLDGGSHPIFRNYINACAVVAFALGATTVAYASQTFTLSGSAMQWHWLTGGIVFRTLQIQDLCDQEGVRERGRSTIPILCGDFTARWTVILSMFTWSLNTPAFWEMPWWGLLGPCGIGGIICARVLALKNVAADRKPYKMWGL